MQQASNPKHIANTIKDFMGKNWKVLDWLIQSPALNSTEHAFHLLKRRLQGETSKNQQQLKEAVVEAFKSITKDE